MPRLIDRSSPLQRDVLTNQYSPSGVREPLDEDGKKSTRGRWTRKGQGSRERVERRPGGKMSRVHSLVPWCDSSRSVCVGARVDCVQVYVCKCPEIGVGMYVNSRVGARAWSALKG